MERMAARGDYTNTARRALKRKNHQDVAAVACRSRLLGAHVHSLHGKSGDGSEEGKQGQLKCIS